MPIRRICEVCGKEFTDHAADTARGFGRYCSSKCKGIGGKTALITYRCRLCGANFEDTRAGMSRRGVGGPVCDTCLQSRPKDEIKKILRSLPKPVKKLDSEWKRGESAWHAPTLQEAPPAIPPPPPTSPTLSPASSVYDYLANLQKLEQFRVDTLRSDGVHESRIKRQEVPEAVWARLPKEPVKNYALFRAYCELGINRNMDIFLATSASAANDAEAAFIKSLAKAWYWDERVDKWDEWVLNQRESAWVRRQIEADEVDWNDGIRLRNKAMEAVNALKAGIGARDIMFIRRLALELMQRPLAQRGWTRDSVQQFLSTMPENLRPLAAKIFYAELQLRGGKRAVEGMVIDGETKELEPPKEENQNG